MESDHLGDPFFFRLGVGVCDKLAASNLVMYVTMQMNRLSKFNHIHHDVNEVSCTLYRDKVA